MSFLQEASQSKCLGEHNSQADWKSLRPTELHWRDTQKSLSCYLKVLEWVSESKLSWVVICVVVGDCKYLRISSASGTPHSYSSKKPQQMYWFTELNFGDSVSLVYHQFPIWSDQISFLIPANSVTKFLIYLRSYGICQVKFQDCAYSCNL